MYPLLGEAKAERPAKNAGRVSHLISEGLQLRTGPAEALARERESPPEFEDSGGVWTGRISRNRLLASALGPALDRQAGFTAARPAANC